MRIWAESASARWTKYKDEDVLVVASPYRSAELGTHSHNFIKK